MFFALRFPCRISFVSNPVCKWFIPIQIKWNFIEFSFSNFCNELDLLIEWSSFGFDPFVQSGTLNEFKNLKIDSVDRISRSYNRVWIWRYSDSFTLNYILMFRQLPEQFQIQKRRENTLQHLLLVPKLFHPLFSTFGSKLLICQTFLQEFHHLHLQLVNFFHPSSSPSPISTMDWIPVNGMIELVWKNSMVDISTWLGEDETTRSNFLFSFLIFLRKTKTKTPKIAKPITAPITPPTIAAVYRLPVFDVLLELWIGSTSQFMIYFEYLGEKWRWNR